MNVKMGKRELGAFLAKSSTKWHPKGGQRGGKWGVVTKVRSRKSNCRNATYQRRDWGLGTGHWGWNKGHFDDGMKARLAACRRRPRAIMGRRLPKRQGLVLQQRYLTAKVAKSAKVSLGHESTCASAACGTGLLPGMHKPTSRFSAVALAQKCLSLRSLRSLRLSGVVVLVPHATCTCGCSRSSWILTVSMPRRQSTTQENRPFTQTNNIKRRRVLGTGDLGLGEHGMHSSLPLSSTLKNS